MTKKSIAWLCNYNDNSKINLYRLEATFPNIAEASLLNSLEHKKTTGNISEKEAIELSKKLDEIVALKQDWRAGQKIAEMDLPNKIYLKENSPLPKETDFIFQIIDAFLVVNQTCYDILKQHNLGNTHFSQVFIYDMETQKQLSDTPYYFINIAETREFLDSENSKGVRKSRNRPIDSPIRFLNSPTDNQIKLESFAADCNVSIWHDTKLPFSLFFSDELVTDLLETGIKESDLGLVRCSVNNK